MAETLILKTNHRPSFFNKDTLLGGLMGVVGSAVIPGGPLIGGLLGAAIGGTYGKGEQEQENKVGKKVGEPSFFNKDTAIGGLLGIALAMPVGVMVGLAAIGAGSLGMAAMLAGGTALLTIAAGTLIGGRLGMARQSDELESARRQDVAATIGRSTSPEIGKAVEYAMEHNKGWAQEVLAEKLLASTKERSGR